jgi:predicted GNAT family acetyltransferase
MSWTLTTDVEVYASAVSELLGADPERYTVLMTVLAGLIKHGPNAYGDDPPVLAWWSPDDSPAEAADAGPAQAAVLRTPPHPMHLTRLPEPAVASLTTALLRAGVTEVGQLIGNDDDAAAFAAAWSAATGAEFSVRMRQRLYRLENLTPPDPGPPGAARIAAASDERVVRGWDRAFAAETGQLGGSGAVLADKLRAGRFVLWEAGGEPLSIASVTETVGGVARVGQVYTPPDQRGRGYGGAVTVAATQLVLDRGAAAVVLFTDLSNPISNSLYVKLGYRPVEDRVLLG